MAQFDVWCAVAADGLEPARTIKLAEGVEGDDFDAAVSSYVSSLEPGEKKDRFEYHRGAWWFWACPLFPTRDQATASRPYRLKDAP